MKKLTVSQVKMLKSEFAGVLKDYNNNLHILEENKNMNLEAITKLHNILFKIEQEIEKEEK